MSEQRPEVTVPAWGPDLLRYGIVGLVVPPGIGKLLTYSQSVELFRTLGIPVPEVMVLVVGGIELLAVVLLLIDTHRMIATIGLMPIMIVAFLMAGDWQAVAVLLAVVGLLAVDLNLIITTEG